MSDDDEKRRREPTTIPEMPRTNPVSAVVRVAKKCTLQEPVEEEIVADLRRDSRFEP